MTGHILGDARKRRAEQHPADLDLSVAVRHELIEHVLGLDAESVVDLVILPLRAELLAERESAHPTPTIDSVGDCVAPVTTPAASSPDICDGIPTDGYCCEVCRRMERE